VLGVNFGVHNVPVTSYGRADTEPRSNVIVRDFRNCKFADILVQMRYPASSSVVNLTSKSITYILEVHFRRSTLDYADSPLAGALTIMLAATLPRKAAKAAFLELDTGKCWFYAKEPGGMEGSLHTGTTFKILQTSTASTGIFKNTPLACSSSIVLSDTEPSSASIGPTDR
jgi:hypothetical protein